MDATFEIASWGRGADRGVGRRASSPAPIITKTYSGDIEGDAVLEYLLAYRPDGTAGFRGRRAHHRLGRWPPRWARPAAGGQLRGRPRRRPTSPC